VSGDKQGEAMRKATLRELLGPWREREAQAREHVPAEVIEALAELGARPANVLGLPRARLSPLLNGAVLLSGVECEGVQLYFWRQEKIEQWEGAFHWRGQRFRLLRGLQAFIDEQLELEAAQEGPPEAEIWKIKQSLPQPFFPEQQG